MKNQFQARVTSNVGTATRSLPGMIRRAALPVAALCLTAIAGMAQTEGTMMVGSLTGPRGGVWLANNNGGGHFWQGDAGFGFCEIVALPGGNPPWQLSNCQG